MKIEVGDIVSYNFDREKDAFYRVDSISPHTGITNVSDGVYKRCDYVTNFKLLKKGEKKMKYKGIEAIERMNQGEILQLTGDRDEVVYKIEGNFIGEKNKGDKHWVVSDMTLNYFLKNEFTEYKEPLKYKVGDKVLVEVEVTRAEPDAEYPYTIARRPYAKESDVKGIDE